MLSHRLFAYGATLACVLMPLVSPLALASGQSSAPLVASSAALHDSGNVITSSAIVRPPARPGTTASRSPSRTPHSAAVNSASSAGMFEAVILFMILAIFFSPITIIYIILYRRARKDVNDMPNYTGVNGPQYGVTGYPQGTVPPRQSIHAGFNPLWSKNSSYTGGQAMPVVSPINGYGAPPAQGPVYGAQPGQAPTYGYGTQPGQAPVFGYGAEAGQWTSCGSQAGGGYGRAPASQEEVSPFAQPPEQAGGEPPGQNYPGY